MVVMVGATVLTLWKLLHDRPPLPVALAVGILAMPILWTLAIGQAQTLVTTLLTFASPMTVALAGYVKLTPWLAGVYWVARRDRRAILTLAAWIIAIGALQLVLEPAATISYLGFISLGQVGDVVNLSPWVISPALWAVAVLVLLAIAWRLAGTRYGWAAAVVLAVGATPRLLAYQLSTLLAALAKPEGLEEGQ
jgi:hypothetical protein